MTSFPASNPGGSFPGEYRVGMPDGARGSSNRCGNPDWCERVSVSAMVNDCPGVMVDDFAEKARLDSFADE